MDICLVMNKKTQEKGPLVDIESDFQEKTKVAEIVKLENDTPKKDEEAKDTSTDKLNSSFESNLTASSTNGKNDESVPLLEKTRDALQGSSKWLIII